MLLNVLLILHVRIIGLLLLIQLSRPIWGSPLRDVKFITPPRSTTNYLEYPFRKQNATNYFREFGWLPQSGKEGVQKDELISREDYEKALRAFQRFASLPETGVLDKATEEKMKEPRCGVKDVEDVMGGEEVAGNGRTFRRKRYTIEGSYWGVKDIRYRIREFTSNMDDLKVKEVIKKAFKVWEEQSPIRFIESDDDNVHINVMFARRSHGDGEPFDGRGQILAHAFFPRYGGDVHFDEEEPWSAPGSTRGIDLYSVAAHEIGHSLGLKHSDNHEALMAPFYQNYNGDTIHLHNDDIKGLQHLYGKPDSQLPHKPKLGIKDLVPPKSIFPHSFSKNNKAVEGGRDKEAEHDPPIQRKPTANSGTSDICENPTLDAITVIGNGTTYAFRGDLYWKLNQLSYEEGFPRNITDHWDGLPGFLDAAITDYDGDTYFFKGDSYWLYDPNGKRYKGYPRKISVGLVDVPDNIDAAMIWNYDDKPYFFKGTRYWQYSRWGQEATWPRSTYDINPTFPAHIDAALKWTNGKTYVFTGNQYYRLTGWRIMKVVPGYPRDVGEWWFGCPRELNKRRKRSLLRARLRSQVAGMQIDAPSIRHK